MKVITIIVVFTCSTVIGELAARIFISENSDNNLLTRGRILRPYNFPKNTFRENYKYYIENVNKLPSPISIRYDRDLGWSNNPAKNDYFNTQGLRNPGKVFEKDPPTGVIRIALFGDSITKGAEVEFEQSWGNLLEKKLVKRGVAVEVLNFGVGGYGVDQIFLRWEKEGKYFNPHIVIFGFFPLDIARSLEIHHLKNWGLSKHGNGFSKPRFIFSQGENLELINYPTIDPLEFFSSIDRFEDLPFMEQDRVFQKNRKDYQMNLIRIFWIGRFIEEHLARNRFTKLNYHRYDSYYELDSEGAKLTLKIMEKFNDSVKKNFGEFIIVNFPMRLDIHHFQKGRPLGYSKLLGKMSEIAPLVNPVEKLCLEKVDSLFVPGGHYSPLGNELMAEILSEQLLKHFSRSN